MGTSFTSTEGEMKMVEMKKSNLKSDEQRIADRLKPSNDLGTANVHSIQGTGPNRVHTTIHRGGNQAQGEGHGPVNHGEGSIIGTKRGPANE
jgi:hypothetical protein